MNAAGFDWGLSTPASDSQQAEHANTDSQSNQATSYEQYYLVGVVALGGAGRLQDRHGCLGDVPLHGRILQQGLQSVVPVSAP